MKWRLRLTRHQYVAASFNGRRSFTTQILKLSLFGSLCVRVADRGCWGGGWECHCECVRVMLFSWAHIGSTEVTEIISSVSILSLLVYNDDSRFFNTLTLHYKILWLQKQNPNILSHHFWLINKRNGAPHPAYRSFAIHLLKFPATLIENLRWYVWDTV